MKKNLKILRWIFQIVCITLTIYMTIQQVQRFMKNEDVSAFLISHFNKFPKDTYPSISICLSRLGASGYNRTYLNTELGIEHTDYQNYLNGVPWIYEYPPNNPNYYASYETIKNMSFIDFNKAFFNVFAITRFLQEVDGKTRYWGSEKLKKYNTNPNYGAFPPPIYISHMDSDMVCLSRNTSLDKQGSIRNLDKLLFSLDKLTSWGDPVYIQIYVHQPHHLLSNFDMPKYAIKVDNIDGGNYQTDVEITDVQVLRKRKDANDPCDPKLEYQDVVLRDSITNRAGCMPVYWNHLLNNVVGLSQCKTLEELNRVKKDLDNYKYILKSCGSPCSRMTSRTTIIRGNVKSGKKPKSIEISFKYLTETYNEIINQRDFGVESLWSSIGGFVGIFVGYSVVQIPDFTYATFEMIADMYLHSTVTRVNLR